MLIIKTKILSHTETKPTRLKICSNNNEHKSTIISLTHVAIAMNDFIKNEVSDYINKNTGITNDFYQTFDFINQSTTYFQQFNTNNIISTHPIKSINIIGNYYTDSFGNTYHTVKIHLELSNKTNILIESKKTEYGYDDKYIETAIKLIKAETDLLSDQSGALWAYCRDSDIDLHTRKDNVLKRDLFKF